METSARSTSSGTAKTSVAGTTQYSASPPIEYIQTGEPSSRKSRVVPSYSVPLSRL